MDPSHYTLDREPDSFTRPPATIGESAYTDDRSFRAGLRLPFDDIWEAGNWLSTAGSAARGALAAARKKGIPRTP